MPMIKTKRGLVFYNRLGLVCKGSESPSSFMPDRGRRKENAQKQKERLQKWFSSLRSMINMSSTILSSRDLMRNLTQVEKEGEAIVALYPTMLFHWEKASCPLYKYVHTYIHTYCCCCYYCFIQFSSSNAMISFSQEDRAERASLIFGFPMYVRRGFIDRNYPRSWKLFSN